MSENPKEKKVPKSVLDGNIEEIIEMIIDGKTYRDIADKYKVGLTTLHRYVSNEEHSARVRDALNYSASTYADKAESVLKDIKTNSSKVSMARARELAQHYRWKAGKRSPKKYGDKLDVTTDGDKIQVPTITIIQDGGEQNLA